MVERLRRGPEQLAGERHNIQWGHGKRRCPAEACHIPAPAITHRGECINQESHQNNFWFPYSCFGHVESERAPFLRPYLLLQLTKLGGNNEII
jgi:hypothetical protein